MTENFDYPKKMRSRRIFGIICILMALGFTTHGTITYYASNHRLRDASKHYNAFQKLITSMNILRAGYIDPDKVTYEQLIDDAINGMAKGLDPFSFYTNSETLQYHQQLKSNSLCGIGASIVPDADGFSFLLIDSNSPADIAGIQEGDALIAVNQIPVKTMNYTQCKDFIIGPRGSNVKLTVRSPGGQNRELSLTRVPCEPQDLQGPFSIENTNVYLIRIREFLNSTPDKFAKLLNESLQKNPAGIIFDLRGCPGGDLNAAVAMAEMVLPTGARIVSLNERNHLEKWFISGPHKFKNTQIPLALLVDPLTASSAEIFAAALKDNQRAVVFGEPSFGKGIAQKTVLIPQGGTLRYTSATYSTPKGYSINQRGIEPTFYIPIRREDRDIIARQMVQHPAQIHPQTPNTIKDTVLKHALDYLKKGVL